MISFYRIYFIFVIPQLFFSQNSNAQDDSSLTQEEIVMTVDSISKMLKQLYIFPDVADEIAQHLRNNLILRKYDSFNDPKALAIQLTRDLQSISKDKHLRVYFDPNEIAEANNELSEGERLKRQKERLEKMEQRKFGFAQAKMLDGRVGYLDLREFADTQDAANAAYKAMSRIMNSDAIIIDLRNNIGGSPSMIQLLSSYFFSSDTVHLNSFYFRSTNEYTETWTLPTVPGRRRPNIDLYILTSNRTFSAAEEFAYNLKHLKRATVIGETTAGGAHPGWAVTATDKFRVWVPQGRAINPITKTNWEGIGVKPDIEAPADQALTVAHINALERLKENATNSALIHSYSLSIHELRGALEYEQAKYADVLVDAHYEKWNDKYDKFYGGHELYLRDTAVYRLRYIDPKVVLGNNYNYVSLPKGSYLTVQFTDNIIIDAPGDDIFINEYGRVGEKAEVHVSSDGVEFEFLGIAGNGTSSFDLANINFKGIVSYVKVIGLDYCGGSPGFEVVRIYGLPDSNIDRYVAEDEIEQYLEDPNEYQRSILLEPVEFEFESYQLLPKGTAYLDKLIQLISENPELQLKLIGHTDDIGSDEFNDQLSIQRAKSVYDYFIYKGIKATNLTFEGRGNREPLTHNETEEGRKRNRRVELIKVSE